MLIILGIVTIVLLAIKRRSKRINMKSRCFKYSLKNLSYCLTYTDFHPQKSFLIAQFTLEEYSKGHHNKPAVLLKRENKNPMNMDNSPYNVD